MDVVGTLAETARSLGCSMVKSRTSHQADWPPMHALLLGLPGPGVRSRLPLRVALLATRWQDSGRCRRHLDALVTAGWDRLSSWTVGIMQRMDGVQNCALLPVIRRVRFDHETNGLYNVADDVEKTHASWLPSERGRASCRSSV